MKKLIKILSLLLILTMTCTLFFACKKDEDKDDKDDKDSYSTPNKDPQQAESALKAAGYDVMLADGDLADMAATILEVDNVEAMLSASKGDVALEIIYFDDADAAKKNFETIKKSMEEAEADAEVKISDNMVYYGTKEAIKATYPQETQDKDETKKS